MVTGRKLYCLDAHEGRPRALTSWGTAPLAHEKTPAGLSQRGFPGEMPDDDLLSHGEAPHYHRR